MILPISHVPRSATLLMFERRRPATLRVYMRPDIEAVRERVQSRRARVILSSPVRVFLFSLARYLEFFVAALHV